MRIDLKVGIGVQLVRYLFSFFYWECYYGSEVFGNRFFQLNFLFIFQQLFYKVSFFFGKIEWKLLRECSFLLILLWGVLGRFFELDFF